MKIYELAEVLKKHEGRKGYRIVLQANGRYVIETVEGVRASQKSYADSIAAARVVFKMTLGK